MRSRCERVNKPRSCVLFLGVIIAVFCVACASDTHTPPFTPKVPSPTAETPTSTPDVLSQQIQETIQLLYVEDDYTCWEAARMLAQIVPEAVPPLIHTLEDENTIARRAAAYALGEIGPEAVAAVPALTQALDDEDDLVRVITAEGLGKIGPGAVGAVPALTRNLTDENYGVRLHTVEALRHIGPGAVDAVPTLIQLLEHPEFPESIPMRYAILSTLRVITGQDFGENAGAHKQWWEEQQSSQ